MEKKLPTQPDSRLMRPGPGWSGRFFSTSNFDLWYFCSLLTYKDIQYLIWKIWFISVWRLKAKVMAWLLTWFIFAQSTLISYHTEAFFKTEVDCTVAFKWSINFSLLQAIFSENRQVQLHPLHPLLRSPCYSAQQATSVLTKASVWYEIRVLWAKINHVKSHAMALTFSLQTDMNQIF